MNARLAKAIRKRAREMAGNEVQVLDKILKPRPEWLPAWIYALLGKLFFTKEYLDMFKHVNRREKFAKKKAIEAVAEAKRDFATGQVKG